MSSHSQPRFRAFRPGSAKRRSRPLRIFFSAGEPSGDQHAAGLIRALQAECADLETMGYGGPCMAQAGCRLHADLTQLAVMWFGRVLVNLHRFLELGSRADRFFCHHRPDAVVLVDYPGFNWWIARRAKAHGIPVFYFLPPQLWAWASWRVGKMRRLVDHVLCALPFERRWFARHGCNAVLVGHPSFDQFEQRLLDEDFLACFGRQPGPVVGILPGSRDQEVEANLRWMLKAAAQVYQRVPQVRFAVAAFKPHQAERVRREAAGWHLPLEVHCGKTPEIIRLSECVMSVSGSVSLELLFHTTPSVILYWINSIAFFAQQFFRKARYITLVNLLAAEQQIAAAEQRAAAGSEPSAGDVDMAPPQSDIALPRPEEALFPEYLTCVDPSDQLAQHLTAWLLDPAAREAKVAELAQLKARVAQPGACTRAARYILQQLPASRCTLPAGHALPGPPHFRQSHQRHAGSARTGDTQGTAEGF